MKLLDQVLVGVGGGLVVDEQPDLLGTAAAVFDGTGSYRYVLVRQWGHGPVALVVMLNPSTATARDDDQTIRRCTAFARREGCGAVVVLNLFALCSTDPRLLLEHPDPVGRVNDLVLRAAAALATAPEEPLSGGPVIVAWGAGGQLAGRDRAVVELLTGAGLDLLCLGVTGDGYPRHPSRLARTTPLRLFRAAPREFRALSTRRPWANLLFRGKTPENRTWTTGWRGRVVIHAGQRWEPAGQMLATELGVVVTGNEPQGYLGFVDLVDVHLDAGCCRPWGEPGVFHWRMNAPLLFAAPIPGPGSLRLYRKVPAAVTDLIGTASWPS
jgi:hypothetical protein